MALRADCSFSRRADGDLRIEGDPARLDALRASFAPGAWTWLRQVHGARVVTVAAPGDGAGEEADAAVTAVPGAVLAVHTADCAPVILRDERDAVVGAAHVGWRGLVAGVLEATVEAMHELGATGLRATVGPHIRARCYEFGGDELDRLTDRLGPTVRSTTASGTPALDLLAGVRAVLAPLAVPVVDHGGCTACEPESWFSHRARGDTGRQVATVVLRPVDDAPAAAPGAPR